MNEPIAGGCECGAIRYRLAAAPIFVNACHCRDCQRITGSAFALNGMLESDAVIVTAGAPKMDRGEQHKATRCPDCQTLLWATHPQFGDHAQFVRLGTLDHGEAFAPDAHFFVRSKHPWITLPPDMPTHAKLPGPEGSGAILPPDRQRRMDALTARCSKETTPD